MQTKTLDKSITNKYVTTNLSFNKLDILNEAYLDFILAFTDISSTYIYNDVIVVSYNQIK